MPAPNLTSLGAFNYASLSSLMVFWKVSPGSVAPMLAGTGLQAGMFDGHPLAVLNFERYCSAGTNYLGVVTETEFSIVVHPVSGGGLLPDLTIDQYLNGDDQTKSYGNFRANVPCDSAVAVKAGSTNYGEIKFVTNFVYNVPNVNGPAVSAWQIRCLDPSAKPGSKAPFIFDLRVDLGGARSQVSNFSPVGAFATLKKPDGPHLVVSSRVVFGPFQRWTPPADAVRLRLGSSTHPMRGQMKTAFRGARPVGVLAFESQPAATSSHALVTTPIEGSK